MSKVCSKCGVEKELSEFGKLKDSHGVVSRYYPKHYCMDCERSYAREWNKKKRDLLPPKPPKIEPTEKLCTKCNRVLSIDKFGRNNDKRCEVIKVRVSTYCLECNCKEGKKRHHKIKNNPDFKEKNKQRVRKYWENNKEVCKAKARERSKSEHGKQWKKNRYYREKEIILPILKKRAKIYNKKKVQDITDAYVVCQLVKMPEYKNVPRKELYDNKELLETKRSQILISRIKNKLKNNGKENR